MEKEHRNEFPSLKMKHFAKLHEKIQNKYEEMQKKLEKSKSVDSLLTLTEDTNYKHVHNQSKYASNSDIREVEESETISDMVPVKHPIIIEDMYNKNAYYQYADIKDASISEFELGFTPNDDESIVSFQNNYYNNEFSKMSLESLNESTRESDEHLTPPTPPPRVSIRNKIGSRISAVKEKCRREDKERTANRDKKKESREKVEKFILSNTTKQDIIRTFKRIKIATVTIALIEATGLETDVSEEKLRVLFCRFRLGTEKHKSKLSKTNKSKVKWQELFIFNMYDENILEIILYDKDCFIGRNTIDLSEIVKEKTHKMEIKLEGEDENVRIFMLLTISGSLSNTLVDLDDYQETQRKLSTAKKKFAWYQLQDDLSDVGWLSIIVYGAKGVSGTDCYCILELGNERLQTHTDFKTNDPNWMKTFTFTITDITSILDIIVFDERKTEEVGKISIPLLKIQTGEKKWFALKDVTQRERARGNNPRILLEMKLTWNKIKASVRVINPKEVKYLETEGKLDRHLFARNLTRSKAIVNWVLSAFYVVKTCFEWESRKLNTIALTIWLIFCWYFKIWMVPLLLLIPFLWYRPQRYYLVNWKRFINTQDNETDEHIVNEKEEKVSLIKRLSSLQEMVQTVQNAFGKFASLGESIKNLFIFKVPFLSCLAIFIIVVIATIMFLIPVKYIFMFWGIHKFTRKILRPNRIPNNEILDLLSRVPDDEILENCEELPLEVNSDEDVTQ